MIIVSGFHQIAQAILFAQFCQFSFFSLLLFLLFLFGLFYELQSKQSELKAKFRSLFGRNSIHAQKFTVFNVLWADCYFFTLLQPEF